MVERAYLLTALLAVFVASVDALMYRRASVKYMVFRSRLVALLPWPYIAGLVLVLCFVGIPEAVLLCGCGSIFQIVHRYWYNVQRDLHVDFITNASGADKLAMRIARMLGFHESHGGHVVYILESLQALVVAIALTYQGLPHAT